MGSDMQHYPIFICLSSYIIIYGYVCIYLVGHNVLPKNHLQKVVNHTLYIEGVQKDHDVGEYTCTAKNSNGQGMSRNVYVNVVGK